MKEFVIFVLDDDEPFCELLESLVRQKFFADVTAGYKIVLKSFFDMRRIDDAVKWIIDNKPDVVFLDYMLGITAGACMISLGVLEKIILHCQDIKIFTGLYIEDVRLGFAKKDLERLGIEVIQKPIGVSELRQILRDSIRKKNV